MFLLSLQGQVGLTGISYKVLFVWEESPFLLFREAVRLHLVFSNHCPLYKRTVHTGPSMDLSSKGKTWLSMDLELSSHRMSTVVKEA